MVALAAGDEHRVGDVPDRNEVVLAAGENICSVGGPAYTDESTIVGVKVIEEPSMVVSAY